MNEKIARVEAERKAEEMVEEAKQLMAAGKDKAAREVLQQVPADTRAAQQAVKLMREIDH
jgi:F0F1-type ATP synthase membrane subunit b/b'